MNRRLFLMLLLAAGGVAVGVAAEHYTARLHSPENLPLDVAVGWTYIAAGLVALARRPGNRLGPLMCAFGFSWFISNYANTGSPLLFSLGIGLQSLDAGFLAHLVLAYPDGRLARRSERLVVASIYAWILAQATAAALTLDPHRIYRCDQCQSGGLAFLASRRAYDAADRAGEVASAILSVIVLGLIVRRFLRSSRFARRELAPLWFGSALIVAAIVLEALTGTTYNQAFARPEWAVNGQKVAELLVPLVFVGGLLRSRLAESSVARLVVALGRPLRPGELRELLARALGDPSLRLAFSVPGSESFVDDHGGPVELPRDDPELTTTFVANGTAPIAALIHDRALRERQPLVEAVGAAARLALENERLQAEVRAQLEEVRASRARIVEAADTERRRIERNLHDGAQQRLVTLSLELTLAREQAASGATAELRTSLDEAAIEVAEALAELRELGRGLHPSILTEAGLAAALDALAERAAVPTHVTATLAQRLPASVEAAAYFVAAEALTNAAKHAHATHITIEAHADHDRLTLVVADNGLGGAEPTHGSGLAGLTDRVAALGGELNIESVPGSGTSVHAQLPCA